MFGLFGLQDLYCRNYNVALDALVAAFKVAVPPHRRPGVISPGQMSMEIAHVIKDLRTRATKSDATLRKTAEDACQERDRAWKVQDFLRNDLHEQRMVTDAYKARFEEATKDCAALREQVMAAKAELAAALDERDEARTERDAAKHSDGRVVDLLSRICRLQNDLNEARKERDHARAATENALFERDVARNGRDAAHGEGYRKALDTYGTAILSHGAVPQVEFERVRAERDRARTDRDLANQKLRAVRSVVAARGGDPDVSPYSTTLGSMGPINLSDEK